MADKWKMLREEIVKWLAASIDTTEYETLVKVQTFMAELELTVSDKPTGNTDGPWGYAEPWNFTEDQVHQWAADALKGAPTELIDLCAKIAWSVLQGSNPDPGDRFIDVEAVKAVAGVFSNETAVQAEGLHGSVTSGIVG